MWPLAVAGAGMLLDYVGARQANDANKDIAHNANVINIEEAERNRAFQQASANREMKFEHQEAANQMRFQKYMSNTAIQRQVKDMKRAGINPMLAAMNGSGATTPSGASGSGASASGSQASAVTTQMQNTLEGMSSAAMNIIGLEKMAAEVTLMKSQAHKNVVEANSSQVHADVAKKHIPQADLTNRAYKLLTPLIDKVEQFFQTNPRQKLKQRR